MIARFLYQFNIYTAHGSIYKDGGIYSNSHDASTMIIPPIQSNNKVFMNAATRETSDNTVFMDAATRPTSNNTVFMDGQVR